MPGRFAFPSLLLVAVATAVAACGPASNADYVERMAREHAADEPAASGAASTPPARPAGGEAVEYGSLDGKPLTGYLARPETPSAAPAGVLLIHEWWGLNDNIRAMARRFAGEGYLALAVDLYEGEVAGEREEAARLARASGENPQRALANLEQAIRYLDRLTGGAPTGVVGWCFGGGWSLRTALAYPEEIDAAVIYYGRLVTDPAQLEPLRAPVLGLFGGLDQGIPVATVREFEAALEALGKRHSIHVYEDADHAFANPSGTRHNEPAAADAWQKTAAFLAQNLTAAPAGGG